MKIAVLGYGTVGSGVVEVLDVNQKLIASRAKEEIEVKNNAESLIYNSEKTLGELGDKISGEEKAKVEAEIENTRSRKRLFMIMRLS